MSCQRLGFEANRKLDAKSRWDRPSGLSGGGPRGPCLERCSDSCRLGRMRLAGRESTPKLMNRISEPRPACGNPAISDQALFGPVGALVHRVPAGPNGATFGASRIGTGCDAQDGLPLAIEPMAGRNPLRSPACPRELSCAHATGTVSSSLRLLWDGISPKALSL